LALAALGGSLGLILGAVALRVAVAAAGETLPRASEIRIDGGVVAFTILVALTAGAVGAILPALAAGLRPAAETLRNGSRSSAGWRRRRWLAALVVLEVAAATALAASSGLLLRGLQRLTAIEPGVDPRGVVTLEVGLPPNTPAGLEEAARYYRRLIDASRDAPGLTGLAAISRLPVVGAPASTGFQLEGQPNPPGQAPVADLRYVEPGAWSILGVPLLAGRPAEATDLWETPRVAWINRRLAQVHFGDVDPIGHRLWIGNERGAWRTIVGVVGDVHLAEVERPVEPTLWLPFSQATFPGALRTVVLIAKSPLAPAEALASLAAAVRRFDALQAPSRPRSLSDVLAGSFAQRRLQAGLVNAFALVAGGLAMIGIYAMTAYSVASRRDELGVRLALGANSLLLARLVFAEALRLTAGGLLLGLVVALAVLRSGAGGLAPWDGPVLLAVMLVALLATACAALAPALRAARTSPARALREG
jgi:putative ABC transport system permease protein